MAELKRPSTVIRQINQAAAPVVSTPDQPACVVGPLYQIVSPLATDGTVNSEAGVSTAARVISSLDVADPADVASKSLSISVNGNPAVTITFPATTGSGLSRAVILSTLNAALSGALARFVGNRLVIETIGKGSSTSIRLLTLGAGSPAYADLFLTDYVDQTVKGKDAYSGLQLSVPYDSLPSPKASLDEIVLDADQIDMYVLANRSLKQLSKSEAFNINSRVGGASKVANVAVGRTEAPALANGRSTVYARPGAGPNSDEILHLGKDAEATIPLGNSVTGTIAWPDSQGKNYLYVKVAGLERLAAGSTPGNYPGDSGNSISVVFQAGGPAGEVSAVWAADTLTITKGANNAGAPTFTDLDDALKAAVGLDTSLHLAWTLTYAAAEADNLFMPDIGATKTFYLAGGEDPVNFAISGGGSAGVLGAVQVVNPTTAAALGIDGEWLEVSVDGGEWQRINLTGDVYTALGALTGATVTDYAAAFSFAAAAGDGATVPVIRIVSDAAGTPDAGIALRASSDLVIARLFGGSSTGSDSVAGGAVVDGDSRVFTLNSTHINTLAAVPMEQALKPGTLTATLSGMGCAAAVLFPISDPTDLTASGAPVGAAIDFQFSLDGGGAVNFAVNWVGAATLTQLVADLNLAAVASDIAFGQVEIGGNSYLVAYDGNFTNGRTLQAVSASSDPLLVAMLGATLFDVDATSVNGLTVVLTDKASLYGWRVESVSNSFANLVLPATVSPSSYTDLEGLVLDVNSSSVVYESRDVVIALQNSNEGVATDAVFLRHLVGSTITLAYSKGWPNCAGKALAYKNTVFLGQHVALKAGDSVYGDGNRVLGRVVAFSDYVVGGTTYPNAILRISEFSLQAGKQVSDWYTRSVRLDEVAALMDPQFEVFSEVEEMVVKVAALRDASGFPLSTAQYPLYVGYKALRRDVSSEAVDPSVWVFDSLSEVDALFGPITPDNPLAWGLNLMFANNTTTRIYALGVDNVSADAPYGTFEAYVRAFEFLERSSQVYVISPQSMDYQVALALESHVEAMSEGEEAKWRMGICCVDMPLEESPLVVISGNATLTAVGGGKYELQFDEAGINLATSLDGLQGADGNPIVGAIGGDYGPEAGIYVDFGGDAYKYRVNKIVDTDIIQIDVTDIFNPGSGPGTDGNDDGFYHLTTEYLADFPATGDVVTVAIRQGSLDKRTTTGKSGICEALAALASGIGNRRMVLTQPEKVITTYAGTDYEVPGFYLANALAAIMSATDPATNLTGRVVVGFGAVKGSSDIFKEKGQMALAAGGGILWFIQDPNEATPKVRHALTTDITNDDTLQIGVTRQIDFVTKSIFDLGQVFVEGNLITPRTVDSFALGLAGLIQRISGENGKVRGVAVNKIEVPVNTRRKLYASVTVDPFDALDEIDVDLLF